MLNIKSRPILLFFVFFIQVIIAKPAKIIYLNDQNSSQAEPTLEISRPTPTTSKIQILIPALQVYQVQHEQGAFQGIAIKGFSPLAEEGKPALPVWKKFICLNDGQLPQIEFQNIQFKELSDYHLLPVQPKPREDASLKALPWVQDDAVFSQNAYYPKQNYSLGKIQSIRGIKIALLTIYPVEYNPQSNSIRVLTSATITIRNAASARSESAQRIISPAFSEVVNRLVINPIQETAVLAKTATNVLDEDGLSGCDYLIVTHREFLDAAKELTAWRRLTGMRTKTVTVDETGNTSQDIRAYLEWAYDSWDIVPEYVLFLGDAEFVPTNYFSLHPSDGQGHIGTDLYYVTLDGNDLLADMAFGRIPVNTSLEALSFVQKVIDYEKDPPLDADFYNQTEILAYFQDDDDPDTTPNERDGYADRRFVLTSEEIRDFLLQAGYQAERIYYAKPEVTPTNYNNGGYADGEPLPAELLRANGFAWDGNATQISAAVNRGSFFVSHRDHGSRSGWGEPSYKSGSVAALTNGRMLPLVFSVNCQTGWFDNETDDADTGTDFDNECFVEHWMRNFMGGAVGVFGSTRISYSGYNDALVDGFFDAFWPQFLSVGDDAPIYEMGHALNYGKIYLSAEYAGGSKLGVELEEFHYYGDPATQFRNRLPQQISAQPPETPKLNQTEMVVQTGVARARVALVQVEHLLASAESDQNGQAILNFQALHAQDSLQLCVTKANYRPWLQSLPVLPAAGISVLSATISDQNEDDAVNMGELVSWNLQVFNPASQSVGPIDLQLSCSNEYITLVDSITQISELPAEQSIWNGDLNFKVAGDCPAGSNVSMQLTIQNGQDILLQRSLNFSVEQGSPQLELNAVMIATQVDSQNLSRQETIQFSNQGFGVLDLQIQDKAKEFISLGDTLQLTWDNVANGIGNIYEISQPANLLRFSSYMKINGASQLYFFVYEGSAFKGSYYKIAQTTVTIDAAQTGYVWSGDLNASLKENRFYYIGVSWDGDARVSRMDQSAPLTTELGLLKTGCVNLGGVPPADDVNQVINLFTPYIQQLETGQGGWLNGLPFEAHLLPGEQSDLTLNFYAAKPDTMYRTQLRVVSNDAGHDSLTIPVYFNVSNGSAALVSAAGRLSGEDGNESFSPGKTTAIPVVFKNLGEQTIHGLSARFDSPDTTLDVQNRLVTYGQLSPQEQVSEQSFELKIPPGTAVGSAIDYWVYIRTDEGLEDTLSYHKIVLAGSPSLQLSSDSLSVESDVLMDTVRAYLEIQNTGFSPLHLQLENPLRRIINSGSLDNNSWWPKGTGFGNVLFQITPEKLQAVRYFLKTDAPSTLYYFVYEGSELKGEYHLIARAEQQREAHVESWVESPALECQLQIGKYYYIGVSWQGTASVGRASETVPYQTSSEVVYSSAYNLGGAPPQELIDQVYKVSYPVAQQLICGQGMWLDLAEDQFDLIPGGQKSIALDFIATKPETTFTTQLKVYNTDTQELTLLPLQFKSTASGTGMAAGQNHLPLSAELKQNYPNPFNNATRISYAIAKAGMVDITVFNILGQRVSSLLHQKQQPGHYELIWQGFNKQGQSLSSGLYFVTLKTGHQRLLRKLILLK